MNFDPNMLGMAMALANTMMQFSGGQAAPVRRPAHLSPAAAPETKKGRKSKKCGKEHSDLGVVVHQQQEAFPAETSAEMYFTGHSLQEHCENNPCYLCN